MVSSEMPAAGVLLLLPLLLLAGPAAARNPAAELAELEKGANVLGDALPVAADDEPRPPTPAAGAIKSNASAGSATVKTMIPAAVAEKFENNKVGTERADDLDLDFKAIAEQHEAVQRASENTEQAMDVENHKAEQIRQKKQDLMIPAAEMAMLAKNSSVGVILLHKRDTQIADLKSGNAALEEQAASIAAKDLVLRKKLEEAQQEQARLQNEASQASKLEEQAKSSQQELGELLAAQSHEGKEKDSMEDSQEATQQESLLKDENQRLAEQNRVLKVKLKAQLKSLRLHRMQLKDGTKRFAAQAALRNGAIKELRANETRLQGEVRALAREDALWNRRIVNLRPLEAKVKQESARAAKLEKATSGLEKNLKNARLSLMAGSEGRLETAAQHLEKEASLLDTDIRATVKKNLQSKAQLMILEGENADLQKKLQLARSGRLRRRVVGDRVQRLARANKKLKAAASTLAKHLRAVSRENAALSAKITEASEVATVDGELQDQ